MEPNVIDFILYMLGPGDSILSVSEKLTIIYMLVGYFLFINDNTFSQLIKTCINNTKITSSRKDNDITWELVCTHSIHLLITIILYVMSLILYSTAVFIGTTLLFFLSLYHVLTHMELELTYTKLKSDEF